MKTCILYIAKLSIASIILLLAFTHSVLAQNECGAISGALQVIQTTRDSNNIQHQVECSDTTSGKIGFPWLSFSQTGTFSGNPWFDVTNPLYGATGNETELGNMYTPTSGPCSITNATATLSCSGANFQVADVGKLIYVYNAGNSQSFQNNKQPLVTTILARISTTQVTLAANAQQTVTNVAAYYGSDDAPALQRAENACIAAGGGTVFFPKGNYLIGSYQVQNGVRFYGLNFFSNCNIAGIGQQSAIISMASTPSQFRLISSNSSDLLSVTTNTIFSNFSHDNRAAWQPSIGAGSSLSATGSSVGISCIACQYHLEYNIVGRDAKSSINSNISALSGNGTTATVTTSTAHNYAINQWVSVTGVTGLTGFNVAAVQIASVVDSTHFTYLNSTSGSGTVTNATVLAVTSLGNPDAEGVTTDTQFSSFIYYEFSRGEGNTSQSGNPFSATNSYGIYYHHNIGYGSSFWQNFASHGDCDLHYDHNHAWGAFQRNFSLESSCITGAGNVTFDGDVAGGQVITGSNPPAGFTSGQALGCSQGFFENSSANVIFRGVTATGCTGWGILLQNTNNFQIIGGVFIGNINAPIGISGTSDFGNIENIFATGNGNSNQPQTSGSGINIRYSNNIPEPTSGVIPGNTFGGTQFIIPGTGPTSSLKLTDGSGNNAYLRISSGTIQHVNSAYSAVLNTLDNSGNITSVGDHNIRRFKTNQGTAETAGQYVLSAGWGTTATVTSPVGFDQDSTITVTSSGTGQAANPTITFTFKDGTWTTIPGCLAVQIGGTGVIGDLTSTTESAIAPVFTWNGTPVASSTYRIEIKCGGR